MHAFAVTPLLNPITTNWWFVALAVCTHLIVQNTNIHTFERYYLNERVKNERDLFSEKRNRLIRDQLPFQNPPGSKTAAVAINTALPKSANAYANLRQHDTGTSCCDGSLSSATVDDA